MNAANASIATTNLNARIADAKARIEQALAQYPSAAFACSFGAEDMVLLDLLDRMGADVHAFTLDTARLHEETYALMAKAQKRYKLRVRPYFPDAAEIESFMTEHGVNAFYDSIDLRKRCCQIRKLEPLARALNGKQVWITGLRRDQAVTRASIEPLEHDDANGLMKLSPLVDWTADDVQAYVDAYDVPVNELHAKGFPSIGCAPCTRAIAPGEDARAGRWWWELPAQRECGLHFTPDGRIVRAKDLAGAPGDVTPGAPDADATVATATDASH